MDAKKITDLHTYQQLVIVFVLYASKTMVHQLSLHMKNYQIVQIQRYVSPLDLRLTSITGKINKWTK